VKEMKNEHRVHLFLPPNKIVDPGPKGPGVSSQPVSIRRLRLLERQRGAQSAVFSAFTPLKRLGMTTLPVLRGLLSPYIIIIIIIIIRGATEAP
jgi:hypothetical protein